MVIGRKATELELLIRAEEMAKGSPAMKPICVPCERFMRMKKSGYYFIEGMPETSPRPEIGKGADGWKPYKVWSGDLYHCPTCHAETIVGVGFHPLSEHYQEDFADTVARTGADRLIVKDC